MMDKNNLGSFNSLQELWEAHPEGGHEGDYATVNGVVFRWNKYNRIWSGTGTPMETYGRKTDLHEGDVVINNDLTVAGMIRARGVKQPNKGLFHDLASLQKRYPFPEVGWWATVGDSVPGQIYRCDQTGVWSATGETGGLDSIDYEKITKIEQLLQEGYTFMGVATPETNPGTPQQNVFYIASTAGIYSDFGGIVLADGEMAILKYNGTWEKNVTGAASLEIVEQLDQDISNKVDKNNAGITIISDDSDTFYVVDSAGYVISKIDATGIHSPNINGMVSTINDISGNLSSLSGDVSSLANLVASIFDAEVENIFADNSADFLVVDKRGYIGLKVSNRGVEGVFLNTNTGGIKNDLRHQNNITPVMGTYGSDNAVYKLSGLPDVFRVAFDFRLNDNINVTGTDKPFVRLVGANTKDVKPIHAVPTDLLVSRNGETYTAISQVIGFNSGFNVCGTSFVRSSTTKKPIVGDTAFSLWLKGNFNEESDFPTEQEVLERASWLSSHSMAKIVFANDTFSVQGVYESDINISIKDGNTYKSLGEFYDDLVSALGDYFVFKKQRLSASKTTADLLQFGTLKLVANYWQQTNKASTELSYNYDSFPVSVPLAIDESLHTIEIIGADGNIWVSVDGQFTKYSDTLTEIYIGGTETESGLVSCSNLEYEKGSLGDAIINNTYGIVSSRTPRVVGVMQHLIEDKYEGETLTQAYYGSVSRMLDIFRMLENRGYTILTLNDVCLWLSGRKHIPARSIFFLATTNPTYDKFLNDLLSRRIWTSASVPFIIGSTINTDVASAGGTDALFKNVVSARAIGVDYITHLYDHDVLPDYKNSIILQQELFKLIRLCISCGIDTRMYSYGWSCESVNYFNMLSLNGFIGAIDSSGKSSINADIQYKISRQNIDDAMALNTLSDLLI